MDPGVHIPRILMTWCRPIFKRSDYFPLPPFLPVFHPSFLEKYGTGVVTVSYSVVTGEGKIGKIRLCH